MEVTPTCGTCRAYNWKKRACTHSNVKIPYALKGCPLYQPASERKELPGFPDQAAKWLADERISGPAAAITIVFAVMVVVGNLVRAWVGW